VYRGDVDAYKASLGMDDKEKPYIYVLDATGKVVHMTSGAFTEEKMDDIEDKLD
jgi:predicted transcriptional regulator